MVVDLVKSVKFRKVVFNVKRLIALSCFLFSLMTSVVATSAFIFLWIYPYEEITDTLIELDIIYLIEGYIDFILISIGGCFILSSCLMLFELLLKNATKNNQLKLSN